MDGINKIWGEIKTGRGVFRALAGVTLSFGLMIIVMYFGFLAIDTLGFEALLPVAALFSVAAAFIPLLISKPIDNFVNKFIDEALKVTKYHIVISAPDYLVRIPNPILALPLAPPRLNLA